jgi:signal transduction histidine kinase/ActR/RegA family two-component response regulator
MDTDTRLEERLQVALQRVGEGDYRAAWADLVALVPSLDDADKARVFLTLARVSHQRHKDDVRAGHLLDQGIGFADAEADPHTWLALLNYRAFLLLLEGSWSDAVEMLVAILRRAARTPDAASEACQAQGNLGCCLQMLGDPIGAAEALEESARLGGLLVDRSRQVEALFVLHDIRLGLGQPQDAQRVLLRMRRVLDHAEGRRPRDLTHLAEARMALLGGDPARALALVRPLAGRLDGEEALCLYVAADAALRLNEVDEAATLADDALRHARTIPEFVHLRPLLRLRGRIAARQGDTDRLMATLEEATAPQASRTSAGLARALRRTVERSLEDGDVRELELGASKEALHRANETIAAARDAAQSAAVVQHEFLSSMSHELRTPLHSVVASTELLVETDLTTEQSSLVHTIRRAAGVTLEVVDDILDLRRLEAGRVELDAEPFPLARPIQTTVDMLSARAASKGLAIDVVLDPTLAAEVSGDERRLQQVLINLLGNAVKFTHTGGITLTVEAVDADRLRFEVRDTGDGVSPELLPQLFEPYVRARRGRMRAAKGTGLGLAICRQLVDLYGGEIGAESTEGVGSTFWFELPLPAAETLRHDHAAPLASLAGMQVLVAEDNAINRMVLTRMLGRADADVLEAADGGQAVTIALARRPAVILMDLQMPILDGDDATRRLREAGYEGCIVALTASVMQEDRDACLEAGMDGFLTKPLTQERLTATVSQLLAERRGMGPQDGQRSPG